MVKGHAGNQVETDTNTIRLSVNADTEETVTVMKRSTTVYLEDNQYRILFSHSKRTGVPMAECIRRAIAEWISRNTPKVRTTVRSDKPTGRKVPTGRSVRQE